MLVTVSTMEKGISMESKSMATNLLHAELVVDFRKRFWLGIVCFFIFQFVNNGKFRVYLELGK